MQAKKPRKEKIINPNAQAPDLIKEVKRQFGLTQDDLAINLKITQQAVSDYEAGKVMKERYDVISTLKDILAGQRTPKTAAQQSQPPALGGKHATRQEIREALVDGAEEAFGKRKRQVLPKPSDTVPPRRTKKRQR